MERTRSRIDERAIGAGTTIRFALLLVLLFVTSGQMAHDVSRSRSSWGCLLAAGVAPSESILRSTLLIERQQRAYEVCEQRFGVPPMPWWLVLAVPGVVLVGACVVFMLNPVWKARRAKVVPLESVDQDGEIGRLVSDLAAVSGLGHTPRIVVDPTTSSTGAVVFGRTRRPVVCLHGGLVARRNVDRQRFRAVLLHELAHIRNRDVTITYFTVAVWRVFLIGVLVPYAVWYGRSLVDRPWTGDVPYATRNILLTVFLVVLVYLARSDLLRSREIHADLAAVRWGADPRGWIIPAHDPTQSRLRHALSSLVELWQTHPRWHLRREALDDPSDLFALRAVPLFLTGAAAGLVFNQLQFDYHAPGLIGTVAPHLGAVSAAVLISGVAGVALWRAVVYATATGRTARSGALPGVALGSGLASSEFIINRAAITKWVPQWSAVLLVVVLLGVMFAWWVTQCSLVWTRAWPGRSLRPVMYLILMGAVLGWIAWFEWWGSLGLLYMVGWPLSSAKISDHLLAQQAGGPVAGHAAEWTAITTATPHLIWLAVPFSSIAVAAAGLVPLLAWTLPRNRIRPQWTRKVFGDNGDADLPRLVSPPPLRRIAIPGALGGIVCWVAAVAVLRYLHLWRSPSDAAFGFYAWIHLGWIVVCLLLAMIVAATAASAQPDSYRFVAALVATQIALLVGFVGVFVLMSFEGCFPPLNTFTTVCAWRPKVTSTLIVYLLVPIAILGSAIAFVTAAAASAIFAIRQSRTRFCPPPTHTPLTAAALRNRRRAVGLTAAVLVVLGALPAFTPHDDSDDWDGSAYKNPGVAPVSAEIKTEETKAWLYYGGNDFVRRINTVWDRLFALLGSLPDSGEADVSPLLGICADLDQIMREAAEYFDLPDPGIAPLWRQFLTMADSSSAHCVRVLQQLDNEDIDPEQARTLSAELGTALSGIGDALNLYGVTAERIRQDLRTE